MRNMSHGKIVLMACGSFSPPTYMHLRMFEIAKDHIHSLGTGQVVGGIVSPVHDAYGKKDLVAAHHRIAMLKLALRSSQWIKVSDWETQQPGWTRTRISMQHHQDTINNHLGQMLDNADPPSWLPDDIINVNNDMCDRESDIDRLQGNRDRVTVKLLCGADLLESFATPGLWSDEDLETIVGRHGLVVVSRAGSDPGKFIYESDMLYKYRKNVTLVTNYVANEVSSTVLRRLVSRGESAKYLTEDTVIAYIRQHRLYGSDSVTSITGVSAVAAAPRLALRAAARRPVDTVSCVCIESPSTDNKSPAPTPAPPAQLPPVPALSGRALRAAARSARRGAAATALTPLKK